MWRRIVLALSAVFAASAYAQEPDPQLAERQALWDTAREHFVGKRFDAAERTYTDLIVRFELLYKDADAPLRCRPADSGAAEDGEGPFLLVDAAMCLALFDQAYAYSELGKPALALASLARAIELDPVHATLHCERGFVLSRNGRHDDGTASYDRCATLALAQGDRHYQAVALRGQGWVFADRRQWDRAEQALRQSLELEPDNKTALGELEYIASARAKGE